VPEVPFFLEKIEAMDSSESFFNRRTSAKRKKLWTLRNLFSTEGRLQNVNDNVVSYHEV